MESSLCCFSKTLNSPHVKGHAQRRGFKIKIGAKRNKVSKLETNTIKGKSKITSSALKTHKCRRKKFLYTPTWDQRGMPNNQSLKNPLSKI